MKTKRNQPEKTLIMNEVLKQLESLKWSGTVIDYMRTPNFRAHGIKVGKAGRLDLWALINQGNGSIAMMYIECKRPGKSKYEYEQRLFVEGKEGQPKVLCCLINDPSQLNSWIKKAKEL